MVLYIRYKNIVGKHLGTHEPRTEIKTKTPRTMKLDPRTSYTQKSGKKPATQKRRNIKKSRTDKQKSTCKEAQGQRLTLRENIRRTLKQTRHGCNTPYTTPFRKERLNDTREKLPNTSKSNPNPVQVHISSKNIMPTAGEARLIANKRARSPDQNNNNPAPSKKPCDPRAESSIPRPIEVAFGKRATTKPTAALPTEAQLKQMEIAGKAQAEQEELAAKAAAAKAAKEASQAQDKADIPAAIPGPSTLILPRPIPGTSASTPAEIMNEIPTFEVYPEAAQADPNVAYPQTYEYAGGLDLNFVCMLTENPHKALEIAKNLTEITQAKAAIAELEAVSKYSKNNKNLTLRYLANIKTHPIQARGSRSTIDLSNDNDSKLPDIEVPAPASRRGRKIKIPAPAPTKTTGFTPSSARRARGRGSRGARGSSSASRGRGAKATSTARGAKRKSDVSEVDTSVATIEESDI